jgi:hypothetical protein
LNLFCTVKVMPIQLRCHVWKQSKAKSVQSCLLGCTAV